MMWDMIKSSRPHRDDPAVCQRCRNPAPPPRPCWVVEADESRYSWSRSKLELKGSSHSCCPSIMASREYKRGTSKSLNLCYLNPTEFPDLFCFPTVEKISSYSWENNFLHTQTQVLSNILWAKTLEKQKQKAGQSLQKWNNLWIARWGPWVVFMVASREGLSLASFHRGCWGDLY